MDPIYERERATVVRPAVPTDAAAIRAIRNHAIAHSTALWTETPEGDDWLATHLPRESAFVAEIDGEFAGFAGYAPWRDLDGYRHTVEDSVYVRDGWHGRGIGSALLGAVIAAARTAGHRVLIADIEAGNAASIRLHERLGFQTVGTVAGVGSKFGRWLDLTIMRLALA